MEPFAERLNEAIRKKKTPAMVGIDPSWGQLPAELRERAVAEKGETLDAVALAYRWFIDVVLEQVAAKVPIVKFQAAYFEAAGIAGIATLDRAMARATDLNLLVILDGKRNDIGATAEAYAQAYLGMVEVGDALCCPWNADALTVNPYLGPEGIEPFVKAAREHSCGVFVLVRTSNPGAGELQDQLIQGQPLYQRVAGWVQQWSAGAPGTYGPVGAVVGATVPAQLAEARKQMPNSIILVPGYGAQGGSSADVASAFDPNGLGAIVNSSRGILRAFERKEFSTLSWQDSIAAATDAMIADLAANTPAKALR